MVWAPMYPHPPVTNTFFMLQRKEKELIDSY